MTTFCKLPAAGLEALSAASIVVFGASEASPYKADKPSPSANAPSAFRAASANLLDSSSSSISIWGRHCSARRGRRGAW